MTFLFDWQLQKILPKTLNPSLQSVSLFDGYLIENFKKHYIINKQPPFLLNYKNDKTPKPVTSKHPVLHYKNDTHNTLIKN